VVGSGWAATRRNEGAPSALSWDGSGEGDKAMRKLILATMAAALLAAPMATAVRAEDTTIIKKDSDGDKTVIKKHDEPVLLPVPHTEERKTIIKKDND
jgi:hypothetical protein